MDRLRRFCRLPRGERGLVLRALCYTAGARVCVSALSFPALCKLLAYRRWSPFATGSFRGASNPSRDTIAWAVAAAGRLIPRSSCLSEAVAAHLMLRRGGWPAVLCLGVLRDARSGFHAHACVESEGRVLVGRNAGEGFTRLARIG